MKRAILCLAAVHLLLVAGCGHNVVSYTSGWGLTFRYNPSSSVLPELSVGDFESLNAMFRENVDVSLEKKGGTDLGKEGFGKPVEFKITIRSGAQANGYTAGGGEQPDPSALEEAPADPQSQDEQPEMPADDSPGDPEMPDGGE